MRPPSGPPLDPLWTPEVCDAAVAARFAGGEAGEQHAGGQEEPREVGMAPLDTLRMTTPSGPPPDPLWTPSGHPPRHSASSRGRARRRCPDPPDTLRVAVSKRSGETEPKGVGLAAGRASGVPLKLLGF
eukprot:1194990-Prorocentrum_minimum.AAC.1